MGEIREFPNSYILIVGKNLNLYFQANVEGISFLDFENYVFPGLNMQTLCKLQGFDINLELQCQQEAH